MKRTSRICRGRFLGDLSVFGGHLSKWGDGNRQPEIGAFILAAASYGDVRSKKSTSNKRQFRSWESSFSLGIPFT